MTLDELLLEWSYRTKKGYPSLGNPSDISVLKEILEKLDLPTDDILDQLNKISEQQPDDDGDRDGDPSTTTGLEPGDEETSTTNISETTYDKVIKKALEANGVWKGSMPIPKGNYKWPGEFGGTFDEQVASSDMELYRLMYELAPPKKGDPDSASKGVGNGELALYWLYKYSGAVNVEEGREGDNPDLEFGGVGVEVKGYSEYGGKQGLGRFGQDTKQIKLLGMIFGLNALVSGFREKDPAKKWAPKEANPLTWNGSDLVSAFKIVEQFQGVDIGQLADIPGFDIFKDIQSNLKWMDANLGEWRNAEEGARLMAKEFVMPKLGRKPRDGGYLVIIRKDGSMRFFNIDLNKIVEREDAINHISTSQGNMKINYQEIFGNSQ
tara:strand:- start:148 stop:1287 length:1140 start_codon:yes stop_codon:yes gene_type:complete